ncbi:hypothetical protein M0R45_013577 [Rubus argutus]|uniref:Cytochrome b561 domain-containing protein n=1 Tax=Rubus argutus TaxID=59490 RepID=A0AAW1XIQ1_RUBAR
MQITYLKQASLAISAYYLLLLPLVFCSSHEEHQINPSSSHKSIKDNFHKLSPQMTFNVTVHGLLLWFSMGFLMPVGILIIRLSVREEQGTTRAKVLSISMFITHFNFNDILSVLLATAGAVMSIINFENSFNNSHRVGLALYGAIWVQALIGFFRPHRGKKQRTELSFIAVYYLFQDKRDYIQKQGVVSGNDLDEAIRQLDQELGDQSQRQNQKELLPREPCGKHNALKNLFD